MEYFKRVFVLFIVSLTVAACSTTNAARDGDPLYGWNKGVHEFNKGADKVLLKPVAQGYRAVVPEPGRDGIRNVIHNLRSPIIFANDLLQAKPARAGVTFERFLINSTFGLLGIFDVAKHNGRKKHNEDMGQTLATWGVESGPYLVLPFLGPSNFRDTAGFVLDFGLDPLTYARFNGRQAISLSRVGLTVVSQREENLESIDALRASSIGDYSSFKSAYEQFRANAINDGKVQIDELPDFDEYEDEE